jgi:hypothetical protein
MEKDMGAVITEDRTILAVEDALEHYGQHTEGDRDRLLDAALRSGAVFGYTIKSDAYVGYLNSEGQCVLYAAVTYFAVPERAGWVPEDHIGVMERDLERGAYRVPLSGWGEGSGREKGRPARYGDTCPVHFEVMSLTGECERCL